jgi:serine/threonine protein kinase
MGETFSLHQRYEVTDYLGAGAYGVVCAARDSQSNKMIAIKKYKNILQTHTLAKRTFRELKLLRLLNGGHRNIITMRDIIVPSKTFSDLYVVFDIMETDLAEIIKSPQVLREDHVSYFTYQLLLGLNFLHTANIVHRDIK